MLISLQELKDRVRLLLAPSDKLFLMKVIAKWMQLKVPSTIFEEQTL